MSMPSVDIIVPMYNPGAYICDTLDSLLAQTYSNIKILLIDDASSIPLDFLKKYILLDKIYYFKLPSNSGGGGARNFGLSMSTAEYVAFCDSDDIWPQDKLRVQMEFMLQNNLSITHMDIYIPSAKKLITTQPVITLVDYLKFTQLYCSTVCLVGDLARAHKFGNMKKRHPFRYWISIMESGVHSMRVPDIFVKYIIRDNSVSSGKFSTFLYTFTAYLIYPKNKIQSVWYFFVRSAQGFTNGGRLFGYRQNKSK